MCLYTVFANLPKVWLFSLNNPIETFLYIFKHNDYVIFELL